ncbi:hypothetical protein [Pedobacter punctiformis]|uniref:Uncharacterized protein n=1 Tax=Pedobacter punctiformis TaxID=3004097 RepID=A0ABT4L7Y8_9SPHI|nr:hypothetical protein [Pedobacter sp. HCMS5-2]MCZ4244025.1 hypothetical protein [Pedobacter sp. HCMS5-2]
MSNNPYQQILNKLEEKASLKQQVYRNTVEVFELAKSTLSGIEKQLKADYSHKDISVQIVYKENNEFEIQLKFSGDVLVISMHSNIFTFDKANSIYETKYVKDDESRAFFGVIYLHNFLADSIKYNRLSDVGFLIARILVNKEQHFMVEGEGQLGFLYEDLSANVVSETILKEIFEKAILHCLSDDLLLQPMATEKAITLNQKQSMLGNSGYPTGKQLGYQFKAQLKQND